MKATANAPDLFQDSADAAGGLAGAPRRAPLRLQVPQILSTLSFGPLFRFVAGTACAGPAIAGRLSREAQRAPASCTPVVSRQPG